MGLPNLKDLVLSINKAITSNDWNTNFQKIVNWLTDGKTDINVKNITVATGGQIENNGSFTQNGNLTVNGDLEVTQNVNVDGKITGDGSGLYNLVSQGVQAFTPFCVNNGHKNSNGVGDLIGKTAVTEGGNIVSFIINFKVDDGTSLGKLKATTANGSTFVLEQLNSDTLAANGTFYYFIGQGQTATKRLAGITIYRQPKQPSSSINDVWLDTSGEELISYKCNDNGVWERWDYVPIGKVVVANIGTPSATATVTTFIYNWNGYNVNIDCKNLEVNSKPIVVIKTGSTSAGWYRVYSDGWIEQGGHAKGGVTITLPTAFKDTNYIAVGTRVNDDTDESINVQGKTTTSFHFGGENPDNDIDWIAKGF